MTCSERLRKRTEKNNETFHRLTGYFRALEDNKLEEYHNRQDKKKKYRRQRRL